MIQSEAQHEEDSLKTSQCDVAEKKLRVLYLQLVTVQMQQLQAVDTFGCELSRVLVHVHAHQPVTDLLIGPLRHWPVLPLVILPWRDRILIQSLQETQMSRRGFRIMEPAVAALWLHVV